MCLAQGHNAVPPVRLEPATAQSRVKHLNTESHLYKTKHFCPFSKHICSIIICIICVGHLDLTFSA